MKYRTVMATWDGSNIERYHQYDHARMQQTVTCS